MEYYRQPRFFLFLSVFFVSFYLKKTWASQEGPTFPTHHFPTQQSFHLSYDFSVLSSSSNFVDTFLTNSLTQQSLLRRYRHTLSPEYQPNPQLSLGAKLSFDTLSLRTITGTSISKTTFADQRLWAEYRFHDSPGKSLGAALVIKFPGYKNPTLDELTAAGETSTLLMGDGQSDISALLTGEYWFTLHLRSQLDAGLTFRTEGFASEIPFLFSMAYVNPRVDIGLKLWGNFSFGNDSFVTGSSTAPGLKTLFANSDYSLAQNPWTLVIEPFGEFWISAKWGTFAKFSYSLIGKNAPNYTNFTVGLTYRWASTRNEKPRTFQEVDFKTKIENKEFESERALRGKEPRAIDNRPILEESSEDEVFR